MPPENNQNFNNPVPQQPLPEKKSSGLNSILLILLIILVGFGIWIISSKLDEKNSDVQVPVQETQTNQNVDESDYQPQQDDQNLKKDFLIPDLFSFSYDNSANVIEAVNPKGSYYVFKGTDPSNDSNLEVITFVSQMGQGFDPATDPDSRFLENQTYGNNKYDVYVMSYGEVSGNIYLLQNFETNKAIIITSYHDKTVPMRIDLASVKFN